MNSKYRSAWAADVDLLRMVGWFAQPPCSEPRRPGLSLIGQCGRRGASSDLLLPTFLLTESRATIANGMLGMMYCFRKHGVQKAIVRRLSREYLYDSASDSVTALEGVRVCGDLALSKLGRQLAVDSLSLAFHGLVVAGFLITCAAK